ncbi:MAG: pyridoxamine 5'-phosphate oxidase family protein [Campylobacterota bacterium]|nr:pyridoxamine 5'-phosphate oxidase family protein [Campylobacterota bacterium]
MQTQSLMMEIDKKIVTFIGKHHLLSLATCSESKVDICSLFYAYNKKENYFVVASDEKTTHIKNIRKNSNISLSIALETKLVGKIQGLQIDAVINSSTCNNVKMLYLKTFPYSVAFDLTLWKIEPLHVKFTDNTLGFGKKLYWKK